MQFTVYDWMTRDLGLKGGELLLYALVYSYSREGGGCFFGTAEFAAASTGLTKSWAVKSLRSLVKSGLLKKTVGTHDGRQTVDYIAVGCGVENTPSGVENTPSGVENTPKPRILPGVESSPHGVENTPLGVENTPSGVENTPPSYNNINKRERESIYKIALPFGSPEFTAAWNALLMEKEWQKKTPNALELTLKKLSKYDEEFAILLIEETIEHGWKGVVFSDTPKRYEEWKAERKDEGGKRMLSLDDLREMERRAGR